MRLRVHNGAGEDALKRFVYGVKGYGTVFGQVFGCGFGWNIRGISLVSTGICFPRRAEKVAVVHFQRIAGNRVGARHRNRAVVGGVSFGGAHNIEADLGFGNRGRRSGFIGAGFYLRRSSSE